MGNKDSIVAQSNLEVVQKLQIMHLGETILMKNKQGLCLLKIYSFSDGFLMDERLRKFKTRVNKLTGNSHVLNIYSVNKQEKKEICANNYQLQVYMQKYEWTLSEVINRRLKEKKNFNEKQIFQFLMKVVQSLIYIQDNGLKNIQLDGQAITFCQNAIKILDSGIACSKTYDKLLSQRQKGIYSSNNRIYLAPELLKDLRQINYDPYISPKADIFSLGMLLFQMVTLQPMNGYYDYFNANIDYQSLIHRLSRINHSLNLKTLLAEMLQFDPDQRIGLISLKQKVQKLNNLNTQAMPRSKSSKMLKEFLSQSRNSAISSKNSEANFSTKRQQSTERKNIIQSHASRNSIKTSSRQLFNHSNEGQKENGQKLDQKMSFGGKQSLTEINKQPINQKKSLQNNIDNAQFKSMVKNKLSKQKGPQKQNKKDQQIGALNNKSKAKFSEIGRLESQVTRNVLQARSTNQFQSSFNKRHFQTFFQSKASSQNSQNSLKKLVIDNKISKLLKIQSLDINNHKLDLNNTKRSIMQQSLKKTSRFGYSQPTQMNGTGQIRNAQKRRISEVYVDDQNQMQFQEQIQRLQQECMEHKQTCENERQLSKVMTFNKQFIFNPRSIEQSQQYPPSQQKHSIVVKRLTEYLLPTQQGLTQSKFDEIEESPLSKMTIKDVPVVISQQKDFQSNNKDIHQSKFGKLQKQLNMMHYVDSIEQDSSNNNSFLNGSSKVISNYNFQNSQADYSSIKTNQYNFIDIQDNSCFLKKGKFKKPHLNIQINEEEQYYSRQSYKVQKKQSSHIHTNEHLVQRTIAVKENNTYKSKGTESLAHFANISPINEEKNISNSESTYLNNVRQFSNMKNQTMDNLFNKITLKNGAIYQGQLSRQGIPHGNGIMQSQSQYKYSGSFRYGRFNGFGTLINLKSSFQLVDYKNIDLTKTYWAKFQGQFESGLKNGFGTIFFTSGQKFSGCWKRDIIQGYGCYYKKSGQLISGLWSQNCYKKI